MEKKYYLVAKETLGQVVICITTGYNEDYVRTIVGSTFENGSGTYFVFEITQDSFESYSYCRGMRTGQFKYSSGPEHMILEGKEDVYIIATGSLVLDRIFKPEKRK